MRADFMTVTVSRNRGRVPDFRQSKCHRKSSAFRDIHSIASATRTELLRMPRHRFPNPATGDQR